MRETGKGLPEVSLMLPLCEILGVSVNELLSGERLEETAYRQKAEENIMELMNEKEEARKKIILSAIVALMAVVAGVTLILLSGLAALETYVRVLLVVIALFEIVIGIAVACVLDRDAGVYECARCGERFVPDMKSYVMAAHTITRRNLRCPYCGQKSYCKKRLGR